MTALLPPGFRLPWPRLGAFFETLSTLRAGLTDLIGTFLLSHIPGILSAIQVEPIITYLKLTKLIQIVRILMTASG